MKPKIKICGIRTVEAAQVAVEAGADFLGFNFVSDSKRNIAPEKAMEIIETLIGPVKIVGVFRDAPFERIAEIVEMLKLDFVQLHGREGKEFSELVQYAGVIKVFSLPLDFGVEETLEKMEAFDADYFMVDREKQGEGEMLDFGKVRLLSARKKIFMAGGLTPENIREAIRIAQPYAVDVAGGVETDGVQDIELIREFITNAKENF